MISCGPIFEFHEVRDMAIKIDWSCHRAIAYACPICHDVGVKYSILELPSAFPEQGMLGLFKCTACGTLSFPEQIPPSYADVVGGNVVDRAGVHGAIKFYIEQGAAPDEMISPLFWVDQNRVQRYAEIGCGFGFSLDFARLALGWEVRGFDPSPLAVAGRSELNLPITNVYLNRESLGQESPFDMVLASEVIEHIPDPHAFLTDIKPFIADEGWLVLSTPNADGVSPDISPGSLLPILSPGYHLFILSANALRYLLDLHGFHYLCIKQSPSTLTVVASRAPFSSDPNRAVDRFLYRDYLHKRINTLYFDQPLTHGYAGRLIKEWVNCGEIDQALHLFSSLSRSYLRVYGIDLDHPEAIQINPQLATDFSNFLMQLPSNLCGLAYRRGFIALHHHYNPRLALAYFRLSGSFGKALRNALNDIGSDDGETEHLVWLSELAAIEAAVACDAHVLSVQLDELRHSLATQAQLRERCQQADDLITRLFTDRVIAGDAEIAELLALDLPHRSPSAVVITAIDPLYEARCAYARGLFALNYRGDPVTAQSCFEVAQQYLGHLPEPSSNDLGEWVQAITMALVQTYEQIARRFTDWVLSGDLESASNLVVHLAKSDLAENHLLILDPMANAFFAYARGIFALNWEGQPASALTWLTAALKKLEKPIHHKDQIHYQNLRQMAGMARLFALASVQPEVALSECQGFMADNSLDDGSRFTYCLEVFMRMVHNGAYAPAAALYSTFSSRLETEPIAHSPDLAFSIGILQLNYHQDPRSAKVWFDRTLTLAPTGSDLKDKASYHRKMVDKMANIFNN